MRVPMSETRVVTLLASATEIVCALGHERSPVGRSHECDYPPAIEALPACTTSKIDTDATSRAIDGQVKSIVEQGLSVYAVDGTLLKELAPDVILVLPCGYDIAKTRRDLPALTERPSWPDLRAVKSNRIHIADGNQYFNRPGPRLVESLEILAELLHPDSFRIGHEGTGWQRL